MKLFYLTIIEDNGTKSHNLYHGDDTDTVEKIEQHFATIIRRAKAGVPYFISYKNTKQVIVEA